jgi:aminoglycoside phosphotransferase (APT) family kinase protein
VNATPYVEAALARWLPPPVRIRARRPCLYTSSFPLEELDVEAGDGSSHALVFKDVAAETLLPDAFRARRGSPPDAARELRAYKLLARADLGTPALLGGVQRGQRTWLFLERVRGARLDQIGAPADWRAVAAWLALAHERLAEAVSSAGRWPPPWRAPDVAALTAAVVDASRRRRIAALAVPLAAARERLAGAAQVVIHGELYPANVLIGEAGRVCVLDWETIARGPALLDLATLTAGRWEDRAEPLAEAYHHALQDPPPGAELLADLDACRLLVAADQLAVPADWTPPPEQARDWLADAELIAERMAV